MTFSGKDPAPTLSNDEASINVVGMRWFPKEYLLSLHISELNFPKKCRGKKPWQIWDEIFDLTGKITPTTATMKLDIHTVVKKGFDLDDVILDELRHIWLSHFEMMQQICKIKFQRSVFQKI